MMLSGPEFHHSFIIFYLDPKAPTMHFCLRISVIWQLLMEKAMAPHSRTLAWRIPWMEEPGRLQSMGSLRVRLD